MKVKLSKSEVELIDHITWGQKERIQSAFLIGVKYGANTHDIGFDDEALLRKKYKEIEVCVKKIVEDGKEIAYSQEWLENLSIEDGDTLHEAVSKIVGPEKK